MQWADGARSEEGYTEATWLLKDGKDSYNVSLNSDGTSMLEDSVRKKHCIVGFEHVVPRGPTGVSPGNVSIVYTYINQHKQTSVGEIKVERYLSNK